MSSTGSKEPTQKDPDDGDDGKTGFNTRNKVLSSYQEKYMKNSSNCDDQFIQSFV